MSVHISIPIHIPFNNSYARLPERFFACLEPTPVRAPRLIKLNTALAMELGLDVEALMQQQGVAMLAGNIIPAGAEPLACAYAGHQFGSFTPQLGDGRAILLGEIIDINNQRRDIQLKGSGATPFSRRGDGRAALGPVLREYIVSEAMFALGVPTTRALAAVLTGEGVVRESILPGAILTRVAASHIRIGTFQYFAARRDTQAVKVLADYTIERHYTECLQNHNPYSALLNAVITRQAQLVAKWMHIGFVHGVMNTDNMAISGETIDYGPCAFMDVYNPETVFSTIDRHGRYAYCNQPRIAQWNLARFAETLMPLLGATENEALEAAQNAIDSFAAVFEPAYFGGLRRKIGLLNVEAEDEALIRDLLAKLAENKVDYTLFFRMLCEPEKNKASIRALFTNPVIFNEWAGIWRQRLSRDMQTNSARVEAMKAVNPAYIPRNHWVEEAISAAVENNDYESFETLLRVLAKPYEDQMDAERFIQPPEIGAAPYKTFCGT